MSYDVSMTGIAITVTASNTFPSGFDASEVADDADPFDLPSLQLSAVAMNVNGDMVSWSTPQPLNLTINVIPGSASDENLGILAEANRAAKGKTIARDEITIVGTYPDGGTVTLSSGKIINGSFGRSLASSGKAKSKPYTFAFQDISVTRPAVQ